MMLSDLSCSTIGQGHLLFSTTRESQTILLSTARVALLMTYTARDMTHEPGIAPRECRERSMSPWCRPLAVVRTGSDLRNKPVCMHHVLRSAIGRARA